MAYVAEIFGSTLKRLRMQRGLTQYQLGALTKISTTFIGEMERGLKAPNLEAGRRHRARAASQCRRDGVGLLDESLK